MSPGFKDNFHCFISKEIGNDQSAVDNATQELSTLLIDAAVLAEVADNPDIKRRVSMVAGSRRKTKKRILTHPKWHDLSCEEAHRVVVTTARLLKGDQRNSCLRSKLRAVTKDYNRLVKYKHKQFIDNMFIELDSMQENNPRGYMQLIRSMREGNFDKQTPDDTSGVSPSDWFLHFSNLLAKNVDQTRKKELDEIISQNANQYKTELDNPISVDELDLALK